MKELTYRERSALRARAHSLKAVVALGNGGLTPGVIAEVERSLKAHELIKIKVAGMEHAERELAYAAICKETGAAPVQHIGKILVVYRQRPRDEITIAVKTPSGKLVERSKPDRKHPSSRLSEKDGRARLSGRPRTRRKLR